MTREIELERTVLEARGEDDPTDPRWPNRLGALYGRYGKYETAVEYFSRALEVEEDYLPAVINMGNVHLQRGNPLGALEYYEAARAIAPDDPDVLLSIAMANHELGNYAATRAAYSKLQQVAPEIAGRFACLELEGEGAGRAAQAGDLGRTILWSDEPDEP